MARALQPNLHMKKKRSIWSQLEALGLSEIVMAEEIRTKRAILNAAGGPLSVKKRPSEPPAKELTKVLRRLLLATD
jgi:hypothetical protein